MKSPLPAFFTLGLLLAPAYAVAAASPAAPELHWDAGAEDCAKHTGPALEVRNYDPRTFVLRETPCATWEAPFMYLLVGDNKALLIDTGDVADPRQVPLASTVLGLLPGGKSTKLTLLVVHSHTHLDHRAGDPQFANLPGVVLVPAQLDPVRKYFGFDRWPDGAAQIDLGGRVIDVLPAPGHNPAHVVYYDRNTGILFSGDFILPGRLLVDDLDAYRASAKRVAEFVGDRPVSAVLGGHIEKDSTGELFPWQSTYHPDERPLALTKAEVLALPAALAKFNGFYTETGGFVIMNPIHNLMAMGLGALLALGVLVYLLVRFIRRRRRTKSA